jgi:hypothetical protein
MTGGALERAVGRASARRGGAVERCELCSAVVPAEHRHVLDEHSGALLCACRACSLLFEREAAAAGHYRLIPAGRTRVTGVPTDLLDVPVGLAFFIKHDDGRVHAHYPSPLGTTEHAIDAATWAEVERQVPALTAMRPRVQALLMRTTGRGGAGEQQWILPVDDCYRLVAVIRTNWTGMAGGPTLWREVARFFADLDRATHRQVSMESSIERFATNPRSS